VSSGPAVVALIEASETEREAIFGELAHPCIGK
jgi:hypothetical protein